MVPVALYLILKIQFAEPQLSPRVNPLSIIFKNTPFHLLLPFKKHDVCLVYQTGLEARGLVPKESSKMNKCLLEATCNISSPFIFRAHATVRLVHLLALYHNYLNIDNNVLF